MKLEEIDRTIFELLRLQVVSIGCLPDINEFDTSQDYNLARADIAKIKNKLIEVFGVGLGEKRGEIISSRITIDRINIVNGDLGSYGITYFVKNEDGTYNKYLMPSTTSHIDYDIRLVANSTKNERVCHQVILDSLGDKQFITTITEKSKYLLLKESSFNLSSNDFLEHSYRYRVNDVYLTCSKLVQSNIPELTEVDRRYSVYTRYDKIN